MNVLRIKFFLIFVLGFSTCAKDEVLYPDESLEKKSKIIKRESELNKSYWDYDLIAIPRDSSQENLKRLNGFLASNSDLDISFSDVTFIESQRNLYRSAPSPIDLDPDTLRDALNRVTQLLEKSDETTMVGPLKDEYIKLLVYLAAIEKGSDQENSSLETPQVEINNFARNQYRSVNHLLRRTKQDKGFTSKSRFKSYAQEIVGKEYFYTEKTKTKPQKIDVKFDSELRDPQFQRNFTKLCRRNYTKESYIKFKKTLSENAASYLEMLRKMCIHGVFKQIELLGEFVDKNSKRAPKWSLAAQKLKIEKYRSLGLRVELDTMYERLADLWLGTRFKVSDLYTESSTFYFEKINDLLWCSRYLALTNRFEDSQKYADTALALIKQQMRQSWMKSGRNRSQLAEYAAEAYHVLGFRIAAARGDFESAITYMNASGETKYLNTIWKGNVFWYKGLFQFMIKDYSAAAKSWESLLQLGLSSGDDKTFYWLAKCYEELNDRPQRNKHLDSLFRDYPVSFYAIVASEDFGLQAPVLSPYWDRNKLKELKRVNHKLLSHKLSLNPKYSKLITKMELLQRFDLGEYTGFLARNLEAFYNKRQDADVAKYLAYVQYSIGKYYESIRWTLRLDNIDATSWYKNPEMLALYFSDGFGTYYTKYAHDLSINKNYLFSITHQESLFNPKAGSHAGAKGLMQLIDSTATIYAKKMGVEVRNIGEYLWYPEFNIRVGSRYLSELMNQYPREAAKMIASYNAGAFVVKHWEKRKINLFQDALSIELIPYKETREYVKRVMRNFKIYQHLDDPMARPFDQTISEITEKYTRLAQIQF